MLLTTLPVHDPQLGILDAEFDRVLGYLDREFHRMSYVGLAHCLVIVSDSIMTISTASNISAVSLPYLRSVFLDGSNPKEGTPARFLSVSIARHERFPSRRVIKRSSATHKS